MTSGSCQLLSISSHRGAGTITVAVFVRAKRTVFAECVTLSKYKVRATKKFAMDRWCRGIIQPWLQER